ncbi:glycosyltransferase family 2 protein [Candidatus Parcubacteria bacterium]|nr:glycosyltransferase family 2 protein [Candidatus Parcubacteria bacterium]
MRTAVLVPIYKRLEYARLCIEAIKKSKDYESAEFYFLDGSSGLRNTIIDFFEEVRGKYEYLAKMDSDCLVPDNWLKDLTHILDTTDYDIISPNVFPSNAAFLYGREGAIVRPSESVGGLWCMRASLIKDMNFERYSPNGISGAFNLLTQIIKENEAKCGWIPSVTIQDIGHWSGAHPLHIKSKEHEEYSAEVRRDVSWSAA